MITKVFLPHSFDVDYSADYVVGVDYGAYILANKKITMDVAIGDFDSVSDDEFKLIEQYATKIIKLDVMKNETDSEAALMYVKELGHKNIEVYSDVGVRLDHLLNNYRLVAKYNIKLIFKNNEMFKLEVGSHTLKKSHKYLSLFTTDFARINLTGVLFPLNDVSVGYFDNYLTSNEIINDDATLEVLEGSIIVVMSDDEK